MSYTRAGRIVAAPAALSTDERMVVCAELLALRRFQNMNRTSATLGLVLLLLAGCGPPVSIPQGVQVYFSPRGGATEAVVSALNQATNSVLVQAYSFTSASIAQALVDASRRGVNVQVILDKSQETEKYSEADFLKHAGIPTLIDSKHAIAHNKVMILDSRVVLTGSFNCLVSKIYGLIPAPEAGLTCDTGLFP